MKYTLPFHPPLLPNFSEFVTFDGFMPHETDQIRDLWDEGLEEQATVSGNSAHNEDLRKSTVVFLEPDTRTQWIYDRIASLALNCNAERYGFDVLGFLQPLQLTEYGSGEYFKWHMDFHAGEISHRKLSVTVQLSDEDSYSGGDLQFMINDRIESAPRRKGTVVVFPSFMVHRVTEIKEGRRNSIVGWLSGPPFR